MDLAGPGVGQVRNGVTVPSSVALNVRSPGNRRRTRQIPDNRFFTGIGVSSLSWEQGNVPGDGWPFRVSERSVKVS